MVKWIEALAPPKVGVRDGHHADSEGRVDSRGGEGEHVSSSLWICCKSHGGKSVAFGRGTKGTGYTRRSGSRSGSDE